MRSIRDEEGQTVLVLALAMGIFFFGAVGLGFDGSHLYSEHRRAQLAADSAAVSAIMSIYRGTSTSTTGYTCSTTDTKTPCVYARNNGFGGTSSDTVSISFPAQSSAPGVSFAAGFPAELVQATVSRDVRLFLMPMLGITTSSIKATAEAAIVSVISPIPIVVLHPTMSGSFATNGGITVQICGGPHKSIQVNSTSTTATTTAGNSNLIDLSHAGPPDTGNCTTGNGSDFGVTGKETTSSFNISLGTTGSYVPNASPFPDPMFNSQVTVSPPSVPGVAGTSSATLAAGTTSSDGYDVCPSWAGTHGCTILNPGNYPTGLQLTNTTAIFNPGIYYMQGSNGFQCLANCNAIMGSKPDTVGGGGTNTGWDGTQSGGGILVYNTGTGTFNVGSNGTTDLIGAASGSPYYGILFFEDPTSQGNHGNNGAHSLGGGGSMQLYGTIYLTNRDNVSATQYQQLAISGNSGNLTTIQGEIIVDALKMSGNGTITMNLSNTAAYTINEVALVQ